MKGTLSIKSFGVSWSCSLDKWSTGIDVELLCKYEIYDLVAVLIKFIGPTKKAFGLKHSLNHIKLFNRVWERQLS